METAVQICASDGLGGGDNAASYLRSSCSMNTAAANVIMETDS